LDIRIRLPTHYPAGYPTGKPDSDHLWCIEPEKHHMNNFYKITYTVHCEKLTYFSKLGQVAELPNIALPENWPFIKSNNRFTNLQRNL